MGRPAGSPNRPKRALHALIAEKYPNFHAVLEMVDMYHSSDDRAEQITLLKEIAPYLAPKLKQVEMEMVNHDPIQVQIVKFSDTTALEPG